MKLRQGSPEEAGLDPQRIVEMEKMVQGWAKKKYLRLLSSQQLVKALS